jgi:hypothetical protein
MAMIQNFTESQNDITLHDVIIKITSKHHWFTDKSLSITIKDNKITKKHGNLSVTPFVQLIVKILTIILIIL